MTQRLPKLAHEVQRRLLSGGAPRTMEPVLRDAWASLFRWHEAGEHVYRIQEIKPDLPPELDLANAPVIHESSCYELPGGKDRIVLARHQASQPIVIHAPEAVYAYPDPLLTYCTELAGGALASGVLNLVESPRYRDLYLPAGKSSGKSGERWLHQDEIAEEERRLRLAFPFFFGDSSRF